MRPRPFLGPFVLALACSSQTNETPDAQIGTTGLPRTSTGTSSADEGTGTSEPSTSGTSGRESSGEAGATGEGPGASTTGSAETTGSGESTTGGPALPEGQWAITEITYTEAGQSETLTLQDRAFCDVTHEGGILLLRYQQQQGYTVWSINMPDDITAGEHALSQDFTGAFMNINEVSDAWQAYFDPSTAVGTLTLTDADIGSGGVVAGTLVSTMTSVDGTTTAEFSSTFYAEIP